VLLSVLDRKWREHLYEMDYLQEGIGLRAMAQRDPLVEYQREGFDLFSAMMDAIKEEIAGFLFNIEVTVEESNQKVSGAGLEAKSLPTTGLQYTAADESGVKTPVMFRVMLLALVVLERNISAATAVLKAKLKPYRANDYLNLQGEELSIANGFHISL